MRNTAIVSLLLVVLFSSCSNTAKLVNPDPISLQGHGKEARTIILEAMRGESWALSGEEPGKIHAIRVIRGRHEMQVLLSYDEDNVSIEYEDSKNLKYKKGWFGTETIHKNYNGWVAELRWAILQQRSYH